MFFFFVKALMKKGDYMNGRNAMPPTTIMSLYKLMTFLLEWIL